MTRRHDSDVLGLFGELLDGSHRAAPDQLPELIEDCSRAIGWDVGIFLVDYSQRTLQRVPTQRDEALSVEGTLAGRCFRHVEMVNSDGHVWVPLIDGVDRLGVMRVALAPGEDAAAPRTVAHLRWVAYLIAHLLVGKDEYADSLHLARLGPPRSVPSELIWSVLPPLTVACDDVVISGALEPTHSVAGDIFDYAIDDGVAHVAIADASGHDLTSAVIGALTLASYRSGRRRGLSLGETLDLIDSTLQAFALDTYATGILGQLDVRTGRFRYVNAGHPSPLLVRDVRVVKQLDGGRRILLGIPGHAVDVAEEALEPGDWLVLFTDGVTEARDEEGRFFGDARLVDAIKRCAADRRPAAETLRNVTHAVLDHQHGVLQDDATLVIVQWRSGVSTELITEEDAPLNGS